MSLTEGACKRMLEGEDDVVRPVLQVLEIKRQKARDGVLRFRLCLSDGVGMLYALCHAAPEAAILSNDLEVLTVIRLTDYVVGFAVNGRRVLVLFEATVVRRYSTVVGHPTNPFLPFDCPQPYAAPPLPKRRRLNDAAAAAPAATPSAEEATPFDRAEDGGVYTLQVRVETRSELRSWTKGSGEGHYFKTDFVDAASGIRLRGTFFGKRYDDEVREGEGYLIGGCTVRRVSEQHAKMPGELEVIVSNKASLVRLVLAPVANDAAVPLTNLVDAAALASRAPDSLASFEGTIARVGDLSRVRDDTSLRRVEVADASGRAVTVAFWGQRAEAFAHVAGTAVMLKDCKVREWEGVRSLTFTRHSALVVRS
eukprot:Rhum_TRINITY_DN13225_c4_g1::Rhum_TRINITY_DN13225_c4_g1_i1::g.58431::m.58431/K07466/RFA1, RPA1, rpa; replication factor A1